MKAGDVVSDKYRLVKRLGNGAMGEVWEAVNQPTRRKVALKLISRPSPDHCHRLLREAQMCGRLEHRNIVEIYDVAKTDAGDPFLVMQLLNGETLAERLRRRRRLRTPIAARIARDVASALAAAHDARIIHRDLKPANIFLHAEGGSAEDDFVVKVLDFGVGKDLASTSIQATAPGTVVGSYAYMSPEQIRAAKDLDPRSDLWTLGIVFFEMLTGERPFRATDHRIFNEILAAPIPSIASPVRQIPPEVDAIVAGCLERDRDRRYQDGREVALALAPFAEVSIASGHLPSAPTPSLNGRSDLPPPFPSPPGATPPPSGASSERPQEPKISNPSLLCIGAATGVDIPPAATSTPRPGAPLPSAAPLRNPSAGIQPASVPPPLPTPLPDPTRTPDFLARATLRNAPSDITQPIDIAGARSEKRALAPPFAPETETILQPPSPARVDAGIRTQILSPTAPDGSWRTEVERRQIPRRPASEFPPSSAAQGPSPGDTGLMIDHEADPYRGILTSRVPTSTTTAPLQQIASTTEPLPAWQATDAAMLEGPTLQYLPPKRPPWGRFGVGAAVTSALLGLIGFGWRLIPAGSVAKVASAEHQPTRPEVAPAAPPVPAMTAPSAPAVRAPIATATASSATPPPVTEHAHAPAARPPSSAPRWTPPAPSPPATSGSTQASSPVVVRRVPVCNNDNKALKPPACTSASGATTKPFELRR